MFGLAISTWIRIGILLVALALIGLAYENVHEHYVTIPAKLAQANAQLAKAGAVNGELADKNDSLLATITKQNASVRALKQAEAARIKAADTQLAALRDREAELQSSIDALRRVASTASSKTKQEACDAADRILDAAAARGVRVNP